MDRFYVSDSRIELLFSEKSIPILQVYSTGNGIEAECFTVVEEYFITENKHVISMKVQYKKFNATTIWLMNEYILYADSFKLF